MSNTKQRVFVFVQGGVRIYFKKVIFEGGSEKTAYGEQIKRYCLSNGIELTLKKRGENEGISPSESYRLGKETLLVGKKRIGEFQTCKPSADYQLPLFSGCLGMCEYCYLHTRTKTKPVQRIHVNLEDILAAAMRYAALQSQRPTVFELAASSDPLAFEPLCSLLADCISFFGRQENMLLRISTKFSYIQSLLTAVHNGHTEVRFSVNTPFVVHSFEHNVPSVDQRLLAAAALSSASYPVGFMIAPVFAYPNWQTEYKALLENIKNQFSGAHPPTFEVITHRYTASAKESILQIYPNTKLDMNEGDRTYKHGQFGYGKYVYPKEQMDEIKTFFQEEIGCLFGNEQLCYCI